MDSPYKGPWFPLYHERLTASTQLWTDESLGVYLRCLMYQWEHGSLPQDDEVRCLCRPASDEAWERAWDKVSTKFPRGDDGRRRNHALENVREEQRKKSEKASKRAAKAAQARWSSTGSNAPSNAPSSPQASKSNATSMLQASKTDAASNAQASKSDAQASKMDANQNQNQSIHSRGGCGGRITPEEWFAGERDYLELVENLRSAYPADRRDSERMVYDAVLAAEGRGGLPDNAECLENLAAWMSSKDWKAGFRFKLSNAIERGWLSEPPPAEAVEQEKSPPDPALRPLAEWRSPQAAELFERGEADGDKSLIDTAKRAERAAWSWSGDCA